MSTRSLVFVENGLIPCLVALPLVELKACVCCGTFLKSVNVITSNACFIHCLVKDLHNDTSSFLTLVYAFPQNNYNLPFGMIFLDLILTMALGVSWDILIISLALVGKKRWLPNNQLPYV